MKGDGEGTGPGVAFSRPVGAAGFLEGAGRGDPCGLSHSALGPQTSAFALGGSSLLCWCPSLKNSELLCLSVSLRRPVLCGRPEPPREGHAPQGPGGVALAGVGSDWRPRVSVLD